MSRERLHCIFEGETRMRIRIVLLSLALGGTMTAQQPLTLEDAARQALKAHPSLEAAAARVQAANNRINQAKAGYLPRVNWQESYQRGDNPVYVFGALLTQRQFTAANFDIRKLNNPDALNNFQSQFVGEQTIYDFGATKSGVRSAEAGRRMTEEERRLAEMAVVGGVARAYHAITLAEEGLKVADEALKSAETDLKRAETVRAAGMATDADVLSMQVHVSELKEMKIRRGAELEVARAALNEAMGLPLDTPHDLATPLKAALVPSDLNFEKQAREQRPEIRQTEFAALMATEQARGARAMRLPQFGIRGIFETDRQQFVNKGGGNWMFVASMRWNLFDGWRSREMEKEAQAMGSAAKAQRRQMENAVSLQVRKAQADYRAAQERIAVTEAVIAQSEESLRILRNRYSNGLATLSDVLRAETASTESRMRRLSAVYDERMAAVMLEQAAGILNGESNVLK